jgi:hypothetical protein
MPTSASTATRKRRRVRRAFFPSLRSGKNPGGNSPDCHSPSRSSGEEPGSQHRHPAARGRVTAGIIYQIMKRLLSILILIALSFIGVSCNKAHYDQRLEITDLQKLQIITLSKRPSQGNIYSLSIHCTGKINGKARMMPDGKRQDTKELSGNVNFTWGGDWYADSVEIRYEPIQVSSGSLILEYTFSDLK